MEDFPWTHGGDLMDIPPTGKDFEIDLIIIYRITGDKIVEHQVVADQMSLMQQLGVV